MKAHQFLTGLDPIAFCQNMKVEAKKMSFKAKVAFAIMICIGIIAIIPITIEIALTFTVIEMNFGPDIPGDEIPLKVYILSFATISAIIAFHVLMLRNGEHPLARLLRKFARVMVVFYFFGMFVLFTMTDTSSLMDGNLGDVLSELSFDTEGQASSSETVNGFIEFIKPYMGLISSLAFGGLVFINLAVVDALMAYIKDHLVEAFEQKEKAKSILENIAGFSDLTSELMCAESERAALEEVSEEEHIMEASALCEAIMKPTLRVLKKIHFQKTEFEVSDETILATYSSNLPDPMPRAETLQAFIGNIEALIARLPSITQNNEYGTPYTGAKND